MNWRRTDKVSSLCPIFVEEFGVYITRVGRFVVEKPIFRLPAREVVEDLDD